jgi:hypothetical protein
VADDETVVDISARFGAMGGRRRAEILPPEHRRQIAAEAAAARWNRPSVDLASLPKATHPGCLTIGDMKIPCAVLEGGRRVLSEHGITTALGSRSGASKRKKKAAAEDGAPLPIFVAPRELQPFVPNELRSGLLSPILYRVRNRAVEGFDATLLPEICNVWLRAREANKLQDQQKRRAQNAEILMRGLAHVGIIALVDEATGYQEERERDELQRILSAYIAPELMPWTQRFPMEFFKEMFRVWGWKWPPATGLNKGPRYAGWLIRHWIYDRLPPGVLPELESKSPVRHGGRRNAHLHRWLTSDIGQPHLDKLVTTYLTILKLSPNKASFKENESMMFPEPRDQLEFEFDGSSDLTIEA